MEIITKCITGSHLYQLSTEKSDTDFKGIYLPTKRNLWLNKVEPIISFSTSGKERMNTATDVDCEFYSLGYFIEKAMLCDLGAIDLLHAVNIRSNGMYDHIWQFLVTNRKKFYTTNIVKHLHSVENKAYKSADRLARLETFERIQNVISSIKGVHISDLLHALPVTDTAYFRAFSRIGHSASVIYIVNGKKFNVREKIDVLGAYVTAAINRYGGRIQETRSSAGISWKETSHALRNAYAICDLLRDGDFEYPLKETDFILRCKKGELNYNSEVIPELDRINTEIKELLSTTELPKEPDHKFWEDWLVKQYNIYC